MIGWGAAVAEGFAVDIELRVEWAGTPGCSGVTPV
jgi:hypothetical protein